MLHCGEVKDVVRGGGRSIRSARKDAGRKSRLDIRRLQLKAAPAVVWDEEEEVPAGLKCPAGLRRTGRSSQV